MKILLVNPNNYRKPPTPPLALEYLDSALKGTRHDCCILDLCFDDQPAITLREEIVRFDPDLVGFSIRNIDTVLFENNIFFLPGIKVLVDVVKNMGLPVILGGVSYSFIPEGILSYLGADWAVRGPGEKALIHLLDEIEKSPPKRGTIINGWVKGIDPDMRVVRGETLNYARYIKEGGLSGFQTQKGCLGTCSYCSESSGQVLFRSPARVIEEIAEMVNKGFTEFHLCDTEFNQELEYCHTFLESLIEKGPDISWTLYMKTWPYDEELFRLLAKSGAYLITLSIPTVGDPIENTAMIRQFSKKYGIRLAIDLLCGFPDQTIESIRKTIEQLRKIHPDIVGVNAWIRLCPGTKIARKVWNNPSYKIFLTGAVDNNPEMIYPVFYNHLSIEMLQEIIGDDPLFKIEGFERTTNYERLKEIDSCGGAS